MGNTGWRLRLQEFGFSVEYLKWQKNAVADAMSRIKNTGGDQRETPVDVDLPVFEIKIPAFYITGPIEMTEDDQLININGPDQPIFAIDDDLDPIADEKLQLGLNEEETQDESEQQLVKQISQEEFIRKQAKDPERPE